MNLIQFIFFIFQDVGVFSPSNFDDLQKKYSEFLSSSATLSRIAGSWWFELALALVAPFARRYVARLYESQKSDLTNVILEYLNAQGYVIEKQ
jgi:hypothetical protein